MARLERWQMGRDGQWQLVAAEEVGALDVLEAGGVFVAPLSSVVGGVRIWTEDYQIVLRPGELLVERGDPPKVSRLRG